MPIVHMVLFKLKADAPAGTADNLLAALKTLKPLPFVDSQRLVVGGPSVSNPIASSQGFHYALLSFHRDIAQLQGYQESKEHVHVVSTYLLPFKEDLIRFDFEVGEDEVAAFTGGVKGTQVNL